MSAIGSVCILASSVGAVSPRARGPLPRLLDASLLLVAPRPGGAPRAERSPARLDGAGQVSLVRHLAHADAAESEVAQVGARTAAAAAAVDLTGLELGPAFGLGDLGLGSHGPPPLTS